MRGDAFFRRHILDAVNQIEDYTNVTYDEFLETRLIQDGVVRQLEIIGEATKNLSRDTTEQYPQIPWK